MIFKNTNILHDYYNGAIPSPIDTRDRLYKNTIACSNYNSRIPSSYRVLYPHIVYDQENSNMCVPCTIALLRYIQLYHNNHKIYKFDPLFIYANREDIKYNYYKGEGMSPRDAFSIVRNSGDSLWNNTYSGFYTYTKCVSIFNKYKDIMIRQACMYKIDSYYSIKDKNDIKKAIIQYNGVSAMFPIYSTLYSPYKDKHNNYLIKFSILDKLIKSKGYHQMLIIGWDNSHWIVQNSWGESYGNRGIVYIPYSYPIIEAWTCIDVK